MTSEPLQAASCNQTHPDEPRDHRTRSEHAPAQLVDLVPEQPGPARQGLPALAHLVEAPGRQRDAEDVLPVAEFALVDVLDLAGGLVLPDEPALTSPLPPPGRSAAPPQNEQPRARSLPPAPAEAVPVPPPPAPAGPLERLPAPAGLLERLPAHATDVVLLVLALVVLALVVAVLRTSP